MPVIIIIIIALIINRRKRKARFRIRSTRTETKRITPARNRMPDPARMQRDADRLQLIRTQAAADLVHFMQVKRDLLAAYGKVPEGDDERTIRRRIAYDNALRSVEKKIEKAAFDSRRIY